MPRRSLKPELNKIRAWVRQGRTDAWIAHQLEVTVQQIEAFKRDQRLDADDGDTNGATPDHDEDLDLRAEDDAMIAAELDEAAAKAAEEAAAAEAAAAEAAAAESAAAESAAAAAAAGDSDEDDDGDEKPRRRRSRRGGRGRRPRAAGALEATFDHGEEGYGLWLDPAVQDDPVYAEYWAGHRPVEVAIEEDQIIIRRAGSTNGDGDADSDDSD
jgi:hypothetical protein